MLTAIPETPDPDFSLLRLRPANVEKVNSLADYEPVTNLDEDKLGLLKEWWEYYQSGTRAALFKTWWYSFQSGKCCGCKTVSKGDTTWSKPNFRCRTCLMVKRHDRPCLRLKKLAGENGTEIQIVEVLPAEEGSDPFGYWGPIPDT